MKDDKKLFWVKEYECLKAREILESNCYDAHTLKDALDTGANSIRLLDKDGDLTYVGYLDEDGDYQLNNDEIDLNMRVEFNSLDRDEDGYTIAIFERF